MGKKLLHDADLIDWWEEERWSGKEACESARSELWGYSEEAVAEIAYDHLFREDSHERNILEKAISFKIQSVEARLTQRIALEVETGPASPGVSLTDYDGWSVWDIGGLVLGGSSAGATVAVGSRVAPAMLGAIGISTLVAPVAIAAGGLALAVSAYTVSGNKRRSYGEALKAGIEQALLSQASPGASVLSRHFARLDLLLQQRRREPL